MASTPFNEAQITHLNEIARLPGPQQQERLNAFLKTLTPEQVEFLKKQQGGGCVFCSIAEGKIASKKVYEDGNFLAVLDIQPAAKGHVLLFPKKHYQLLGQMSSEEVGRLFVVATTLSRAVFEGLQAEGTNMYVASGAVAGQIVPHVVVHLIPRWKGDTVHFSWEGIRIDEQEMNSIHERLIGLVAQLFPPTKEEITKEEPPVVEWDEEERIP